MAGTSREITAIDPMALDLPFRPESASVARHQLVEWMRTLGVCEEASDDARLVVSELVGNAVRHGAPPFGVCIDWHDDPPILCVVDRGRGMRQLYPVPDSQSECGRGLLLVRALAGELVVDASAEERAGTRVVVALPVSR